MTTPVIAVVGSAMMDLTAYTDVIPAPGQTVIGKNFVTGFGGKVQIKLCFLQNVELMLSSLAVWEMTVLEIQL